MHLITCWNITAISSKAVLRGARLWGCASAMVALGGCTTTEEVTPEPSATPTSTPTPAPTPWPLTLDEEAFSLLAPSAISVQLAEGEDPKVLQPAGLLDGHGESFSGTLSWSLYESVEDFKSGLVACTYDQYVEGQTDLSLYPSIACEDCQAYFRVQASPPETHTCPSELLLALLDQSRDGQLSEQELNPVDQWGFSPFDMQTAPSAWEAYSNWCSLGTYLYCWGGRYVAWSRAWATAESAYTPLVALHPPIPDPQPSSCPFGEGAVPEGCATPIP